MTVTRANYECGVGDYLADRLPWTAGLKGVIFEGCTSTFEIFANASDTVPIASVSTVRTSDGYVALDNAGNLAFYLSVGLIARVGAITAISHIVWTIIWADRSSTEFLRGLLTIISR